MGASGSATTVFRRFPWGRRQHWPNLSRQHAVFKIRMRTGHSSTEEPKRPARFLLKFRSAGLASSQHSFFPWLEDDKPTVARRRSPASSSSPCLTSRRRRPHPLIKTQRIGDRYRFFAISRRDGIDYNFIDIHAISRSKRRPRLTTTTCAHCTRPATKWLATAYLGKGLLRDFEIEALPTRNRGTHTFASKQILGVSTRRGSDAGELHSPPDFL